jgi:cellobiose-specific phosphotransferase system component IIA
MSIIHQATTGNIQKNSERYILQGNKYAATAIQHAEEGKTQLAEQCAEEADKKYQEAEDAELATKLQHSEFSGNRLQ